MPCRDDSDYGGNFQHHEIQNLKEENDRLTSMLCTATSMLHQANILKSSKGLNNWYREHIKEDLQRIKSQIKSKPNALELQKYFKTLTPNEIKLLDQIDLTK